MSLEAASDLASKPARPAGPRRLWMPIGVVLFGAIGYAVCWYALPDEVERIFKVVGTYLLAILVPLLLAVWFAFFSGTTLRFRLVVLAILLLAGGAAIASIRRIEYDGDTAPILHFRWSTSRADVLDAHRGSIQDASGSPPIGPAGPEDFPQFRGPNRDGVAHGPPLSRDWTARPPRLLWSQPIGEGYAGFAVVGDSLVTIEQRRSEEVVVRYDARDGREVWTHAWPARFEETMGGPGPRATPTIHGGDVYALGATGRLVRLDGTTGRPRWDVDILSLNGSKNLEWAMSGSPLIVGNLVVVSPGAQGGQPSSRCLIALDIASGKQVWGGGAGASAYSSPMLATIEGTPQILLLAAEGLFAHDLKSGDVLWSFSFQNANKILVAMPIPFDGNRVFVSAGYGAGCAAVEASLLDGKWSTKELYRNLAMKARFTNPVYKDGKIYGLDDGILACMDAASGSQHWKKGRYGHGQLILSGDLLVVLAEDGRLALVEARPDRFAPLGSIQALSKRKTWNTPALARGIAYLRNHEEMAAYDLRADSGESGP